MVVPLTCPNTLQPQVQGETLRHRSHAICKPKDSRREGSLGNDVPIKRDVVTALPTFKPADKAWYLPAIPGKVPQSTAVGTGLVART